ncbi:hypothetical protein [Lysinibacillus capsici]|uniref:hypothetical protein n=1 Tax=Lysinibacillus capsici TaxID=2115968 RepID=UPI002FDE3F3A
MHVYEIDDKGFIINNYYDNGDVEIPDGCITVQLPQPMPFHKPKWKGTEWVEGETEEEKAEREEKQLIESLKPSPQEIANAEIEIKILTMLAELEVVQ